MVKNKIEKLTKYEKKYVDLFGELYAKRGLPNTLGQIYAILALKANTPEEGMVQQEIATLIDRSVSAVSRLLSKLEKMKYCEYIEVINPNNRRERKYYMSVNVQEIALRRFKLIIQENIELKSSLQDIKEEIEPKEKEENKEFIDFLGNLTSEIDKLLIFYEKLITMSRNIL